MLDQSDLISTLAAGRPGRARSASSGHWLRTKLIRIFFFFNLQMVKFHCNAGHMMEGQPISTCTERELEAGKRVGHWSSEVPRCVKACTYPGSVIGGMIDDVRFYYGVGDKVCELFCCLINGMENSVKIK